MKKFYVYIMSSGKNGTLYIGVTSDLTKRVWQHKNKIFEGFTEKYDIIDLVHYEVYDDAENAIKREKRLKHWIRSWKIDLIQKQNPEWKDLYDSII